MVSALFGTRFRLQKIDIRHGSVESWVYIAGGFTLISQYADFVRSMELLQTQIRNLLIGLFANSGLSAVTITGGWMPVKPKPNRLASFRTSPGFHHAPDGILLNPESRLSDSSDRSHRTESVDVNEIACCHSLPESLARAPWGGHRAPCQILLTALRCVVEKGREKSRHRQPWLEVGASIYSVTFWLTVTSFLSYNSIDRYSTYVARLRT